MGHSAQDNRVLGLSLSSDGLYDNEVTNQIDGAQDLTKPFHFLGLPYEVAHHILTFLDFKTLRDGMSLTSRNVQRVCAYLLFRSFKFLASLDQEHFERLDQFMNTTSVSVVKRLSLSVSGACVAPEDKAQKSLERLIGIFTKFSHLIELTLSGNGKDLGSFPAMWTSSAQCQLETIRLSIADDITQSKWGGFLTSQPKLRHLAIYYAESFEVPPIPSLKSVKVELMCGHVRFHDNMSSTLQALEYLSLEGVYDTISLLDMPSLKQLRCSGVQKLVMDSEFPNLTDLSLNSIHNFIPPTIPLPSLSKLRMVGVPLHLARGCTTLTSVEFLDRALVWPRRPHDLESLKDSALSLRSLTISEDHRSDSEIPPSYQVIRTFTFLTDLTIRFHFIPVQLCWSPLDQKCPTSSLFGVVKSLKHLQTLSWEVTVSLVDPTEEETTDYLDEGIVRWLDDMSDGYARVNPSLLHAEFRCHGIHDMLSREIQRLGWWVRHTRASVADPFKKVGSDRGLFP